MDAIPFDAARPRRAVLDAWNDVKAGLDFVAHNLPRAHRVLSRVNPYPRPWRAVRLPGAEGASLAAVYGPGRPGAGALLILPGTFQTKDDTSRKRRAIGLWRRFGLHVLVLDQRGFGGSFDAPPTGGWLEAADAHLAADWLRHESGAPRVTLWGESLGGAVALLAAARPGAEARFERVVAWSPFADLADATAAADPRSPRGRTLLGRTYRWLLRERTHGEAQDFGAFLALRAHALGLPLEELVRLGSPLAHVRDLRVPALVLHAEDDPVVPVAHARKLADARAPRLDVQIVPRGRHLDFDREAPQWYARLTQALLASPTA
ncbi:MAG: uncharacterized protein QOE90_1204 [Thermoplasmata archaeon]|jgi:alpha-beta hydrolase superfamily lysophospholipase|nr:uncharacterized protein [Thermoplasmata archaeon]